MPRDGIPNAHNMDGPGNPRMRLLWRVISYSHAEPTGDPGAWSEVVLDRRLMMGELALGMSSPIGGSSESLDSNCPRRRYQCRIGNYDCQCGTLRLEVCTIASISRQGSTS